MRSGDIVADRFEIQAVAGTGGMGTVYRAKDLVAGGPVALKTLAGIGERDAARFAREAAVLAELVHPGIVRYVAHGMTTAHEHYIAMEWLEGETLHERLSRGRLRIAEAIALGRAVADAIGAAHAHGVVHRDLKPMNLLLPDGDLARVKVLDFGIARHIAHAGVLTNTGTVLGTPGYMAPEQVRGETTVDARTDVFALGCVMYRCLTGSSAFGGDESLAVLAKILLEEVTAPSAIEPTIPQAIDQIVLRMLDKNPAARPVDGRAVVTAFARLGDLTLRDDRSSASVLGVGTRDAPAHGDTIATTDGSRIAITETEQRLVSVVLSSPLAESITEPERLAITATAFGGKLERIADGANLVLFAHAEVASDHAARAARCALALRDVLPQAAFVVASGRATLERLPVGDVIDRAVALVRDALAGQILVDSPTSGLLDERFAITERGERRYLRGLRDANEPVRTLLGKATPIVGRDRELANLEGLWAECTDERVARAVLVTAPPGGGKSRLRQELVRRVLQRDEHSELLIGRADSLRAGSPFGMAGDAIRRAAGVRDGDPLADQRAALCTRVARNVPAESADRVAHMLGEIAGVAFPSEASEALREARRDPQARGDAMREAWIEWLAGECAHHPVLLVLEDLHWGDRPTVELVDAALRELDQAPLMVVALARPEVRDVFPKLWAERDLQEIRLPQLTKKASEKLVRDLLGTDVDAETIERIVERSAGNAFFLEELIRAVAEGRDGTLPDSVLSMLQLRLDALGTGPKRVLRAASVFGETFWRGGVQQLLDEDPRDELDVLVKRELIQIVPEPQLADEVEYAFRHDLVREAAYALMPASDRVLAHRLAGDWLVAHHLGDPLVLANHFALGNEPMRAAASYARAAEQALAGNDDSAALAHVERGLALSADGKNGNGDLAGQLYLVRAEAHNWRGEHVAAIAAADQARALVRRGSRPWFRGGDELFYGAGRLGDIARAIVTLRDLTSATPEDDAKLEQLRSVARAAIVMFRFGPPDVGAALVQLVEQLAASVPNSDQRLHTLRAMVARSRGEAGRCIAEHEAALAACERVHDLREVAFTYLSHGGTFTELGAPETALPLLQRGVQVAERVGATTILTLLLFSLSLTELELGHLEDSRTHATRALAGVTDADRAAAGLAHWVLARVASATGDRAACEREITASLERLAPFPEYHAIALATASFFARVRGDTDAAVQLATEGLARMRLQDGFQEGESLVRLCAIEAFEAAGQRDRAAEETAVAITRLDQRAARIDEPWRTRFLARPHHAATLARR